MKKSILTASLLAFSITSFATDIRNEELQGVRNSNGEICILAHQQLDYAYPELLISFHSATNESWKVADAGLLEAMGLDFQTYKKVLYGNDNVSTTTSKGTYNYTINASSSGATRTVTLQGISNIDGNRASTGTIILKNNQVESVSIAKQAKSIFGRWKTIFQDTCSSITKNY